MTRRRWIADEVDGDRAALTGQNAAHLARVLRGQVGQEFDIATGETVRWGRISRVSEDRVEFELGEMVEAAQTAPITILLAIFKFDRFEWAVEKCTELGASRIVPVIAKRSDAHLVHAAGKRVERWQRIAREAAQQSRRVAPPEIAAPAKLKEAIASDVGARIVLSEAEDGATLGHALRGSDLGSGVLLAIGPEGGWTEDELKSFAEAGWKSASLGTTILRAETAAIAALAIASSAIDETE
jgi:16S rRNA (uracil1498-N3)-methyltransferase